MSCIILQNAFILFFIAVHIPICQIITVKFIFKRNAIFEYFLSSNFGYKQFAATKIGKPLTLYSPGGGGGAAPAPLDIFRDKSAVRKGFAARFHEFFPYCFAHILRPNLWRPGVTKLRNF